MQRLPWVTFGIGIASVILSGFGQAPYLDALALDRQAPLEVWRWMTAHLGHTDATHLLWNMFAWMILAGTLEWLHRGLLIWTVSVGAVTIDIWFWFISGLASYTGLSGILNAVFVVLLYRLFNLPPITNQARRAQELSADRWLLILVYLGAWGKALFELATQQQFMPESSWPSVPAAHISGMLAGTLICIASYIRDAFCLKQKQA